MLTVAVAVVATLLPTWRALPVEAAVRGRNGKIIMNVHTQYFGWLPGSSAADQYGPNDPACDLWTVEADGSDPTNITATPGCDVHAVWSPDGSKIAFESNRDGDADIYVMDQEGRHVTRLTNWPSKEYFPVWSPDGRRIAFLSDRSRGTEIVLMRGDGSGKKVIASLDGHAWEPSWSPRAPKILFTLEKSHLGYYDTNDDEDIFVLNLRSGRVRPVIATPDSEFTPAWSPDGKHIAFASRCSGCEDDIFVADADGSNVRQLTDSPESDWNPAWSPDGKWIAFSSNEDDPTRYANWDVFVMDAQGGNRRRLLLKPDSFDAAPDWQPLPLPGS